MRFVAETGSTNADLLAEAGQGAAEGAWLRAGRQTAGRGRLGRSWASAPRNLFASTLVRLRPADPPAPGLALVAAVALDEAMRRHAPDAALSIKWPNDLMLGSAKLAGILLERSGEAVVAGFGVNLASAPDVPGRTTAALGAAVGPEALCETLADCFAAWLARWRADGLEPVRQQWMARAYPDGTALRVAMPGAEAVDGVYRGLTADGALRLETATETIEVRAGDVFLIS
ncbi:biotin--[acetyl-CoA-carboxylase] ligase [Sphingomonas jejuensis]|uniref:biotin--[acetyl-CoA-carboxylase] ligase n=1 Tax=Sphingomonas jejuensis TaxID=904715 RepID=UPI0031592F6F